MSGLTCLFVFVVKILTAKERTESSFLWLRTKTKIWKIQKFAPARSRIFFPNIFLRLRLRLLISDGTSDGVWVSLNKMKTDLDHEKSPQLLQLAANAVKCIGTIYHAVYIKVSRSFWKVSWPDWASLPLILQLHSWNILQNSRWRAYFLTQAMLILSQSQSDRSSLSVRWTNHKRGCV